MLSFAVSTYSKKLGGLVFAKKVYKLLANLRRRHDTRHNGTQPSNIQNNFIHHSGTQHNDIQNDSIQHNDTQYNDAEHQV
jgi:hypothetical protein